MARDSRPSYNLVSTRQTRFAGIRVLTRITVERWILIDIVVVRITQPGGTLKCVVGNDKGVTELLVKILHLLRHQMYPQGSYKL